jgi:hypothetical protein
MVYICVDGLFLCRAAQGRPKIVPCSATHCAQILVKTRPSHSCRAGTAEFFCVVVGALGHGKNSCFVGPTDGTA